MLDGFLKGCPGHGVSLNLCCGVVGNVIEGHPAPGLEVQLFSAIEVHGKGSIVAVPIPYDV